MSATNEKKTNNKTNENVYQLRPATMSFANFKRCGNALTSFNVSFRLPFEKNESMYNKNKNENNIQQYL